VPAEPKPPRGTFKGERRHRRGQKLYRQRKIYALVDVRDLHRCRYCGRRDTLSHHHIKPVGTGGPDETWNIVLLCQEHHDAAQNGTPRLLIEGNPDVRGELRFTWTKD
jgi:5-methylcytosine-specific restriction endonuclease McrA